MMENEDDRKSREEESWLLAGTWTPEFGEEGTCYKALKYIKGICCILALAIVCLYVMTAGETGTTDDVVLKDVSKPEGENQHLVKQESEETPEILAPKELAITVVDEFPPENELECRMIGENGYEDEEDESDSIFSKRTNLVNTIGANVWFVWEDGKAANEEGIAIHLNTAKFFVPDGGSRCFGAPNFSTEIYGDGEWEKRRELDEINLIGGDDEKFNGGIDATRELVNDGYLDEKIRRLLERFPQINPYERKYTLELVTACTTDRQTDGTEWWDVDYSLCTEADNGELIRLAYLEIYRVTCIDGEPTGEWWTAEYRIDVNVDAVWQLTEDPADDKGEVWLQQITDGSVASEEAAKAFVEEYGAQIVIPQGANAEVDWKCRREEYFYYDYLVWEGESTGYSVTLAIPMMEKKEEGYYIAARIRKEASDQETCRHILSGMMQTFHGMPYLHVVKEGESLTKIAEKYSGGQSGHMLDDGRLSWLTDGGAQQMQLYDESTGSMTDFDNPDLIYPGQKVSIPYLMWYDGREMGVIVP